jgi:hypothetical protein
VLPIRSIAIGRACKAERFIELLVLTDQGTPAALGLALSGSLGVIEKQPIKRAAALASAMQASCEAQQSAVEQAMTMHQFVFEAREAHG